MALVTNVFTGQTRRLGESSSNLVAPWVLDLTRNRFVTLRVFALMQKIFTDCYRFSTKIDNEDKEMALFDAVVYKKAQYGLISHIAWLIATKSSQYLIYDNGIVRKALYKEKRDIDRDYKTGNIGAHGIILDFTDYAMGELLAHYMHQIYSVEEANNASISLGGSTQLKLKDLRAKLGSKEALSPEIQSQASQICGYAKDGKPIVIDAGDEFMQTDTSKNVEVGRESKDKTYQELAALLGCLPSYITGIDEKTNGSGDSYERIDGRAEDMIKNFWITVFHPIVKSLLDVEIKFVSQKWQQIKENLGSISIVETLNSVPDPIKASVIAKLVGDNEGDKNNGIEQEILKLLQSKPEPVDNDIDEDDDPDA